MFSDILGLYEQSIERAAREARVGQSRRDILVAVRQDFGGKITNELLFEALGGMIGREELVEDADGTLHLIGESEPGCHKRARPTTSSAADTPVKGAVPGSVQPAPRQLAEHLSQISSGSRKKECVQCGVLTYHSCTLCEVPMCKLTVDKACCLEYHMLGAGAETVFSGVEVGASSSKRAGACLATLL
jgi:hypothetical protein